MTYSDEHNMDKMEDTLILLRVAETGQHMLVLEQIPGRPDRLVTSLPSHGLLRLSCPRHPLVHYYQAAEGRASAQIVLNLQRSCLTLDT